MNSFNKAIALAILLSVGASAAQARPVENELARTQSTITVHGIFDAR